MGALKIPQKMSYSRANHALCARIGVMLDGVSLGTSCVAYDVPAGWVLLNNGDRKTGAVEPFWR